MTSKRRKSNVIAVIIALMIFIISVSATITFSRFSDGYRRDDEGAKPADAIAKVEVNAVYRKAQGVRTSAAFDKKADTVTLYDVEPEDEIEYYFTVSGIDGTRSNEVTMNVTLNISVRLETIATDGTGKHTDYFAGWTRYEGGIKDNGYLRVYHGGESDSSREIRLSSSGSQEVDYTGNTLAVVTTAESTVNKTGLVMAADDAKKEYAYHLVFALPRQNAEKESYAGARVYFEIQSVAEQAKVR